MLQLKSSAHLQMTPVFPQNPHKYCQLYFFTFRDWHLFLHFIFLPCADTTCACFPKMVQHNLWMSSYLWMYSSDCRWNTFFLCVSFLMIPASAQSLPSQGVITKQCSSACSSYKFPKGLPWCERSCWLSVRLRNSTSPYLAIIWVIWDLAWINLTGHNG